VKNNQKEPYLWKVVQVRAYLAIVLMIQQIAEIKTKQPTPSVNNKKNSGVFAGLCRAMRKDELGSYSVHSTRDGCFETSMQRKRHRCSRITSSFCVQGGLNSFCLSIQYQDHRDLIR
jgi:hypothetical protein